jgi:hypothetical protein
MHPVINSGGELWFKMEIDGRLTHTLRAHIIYFLHIFITVT